MFDQVENHKSPTVTSTAGSETTTRATMEKKRFTNQERSFKYKPRMLEIMIRTKVVLFLLRFLLDVSVAIQLRRRLPITMSSELFEQWVSFHVSVMSK